MFQSLHRDKTIVFFVTSAPFVLCLKRCITGAAAYSPSPKQDTLSPDFPRFLQGEERGISFYVRVHTAAVKDAPADRWRRLLLTTLLPFRLAAVKLLPAHSAVQEHSLYNCLVDRAVNDNVM